MGLFYKQISTIQGDEIEIAILKVVFNFWGKLGWSTIFKIQSRDYWPEANTKMQEKPNHIPPVKHDLRV